MPTEEQRTDATIALLARMGIREGVISRIEQRGGPRDSIGADRYADALWGAGRYRDALAAWRIAFSGPTLDERARFQERRGAVMWIRGEYRAAERILRAALNRWVYTSSPLELRTQLRLVETYGRVLTHMRSSPETRPLATKNRRRRAITLATALREELQGSEGIHGRATIPSMIANLSDTDDKAADNHVKEFEEAEALHAWLNYRHHALRQHARHGMIASPAQFDELMHAQLIIGANGDAARVLLLPGAAAVYSVRETIRVFSKIDVTSWHRIRIIARSISIRATAKIKKNEPRRDPHCEV